MATELKRYVGSRIPAIGTPVVLLGADNNEGKKEVFYEIHVFFLGVFKFYKKLELIADYSHLDQNQISYYIAMANTIIDDEIEKHILEAIESKNIPTGFYKPLELVDKDKFFIHILSLWAREDYDEEIKDVAYKSRFFKSEFSAAMQLPKIKVKVSAAKVM